MIEVEVVTIDISDNKCVSIKKMGLDSWYNLSKEKGYIYFAFQIGFHSFKVEKT